MEVDIFVNETNCCCCNAGDLCRPDLHTEIRTRVDSEAIVGASLKQQITPQLSLTLCSEVMCHCVKLSL